MLDKLRAWLIGDKPLPPVLGDATLPQKLEQARKEFDTSLRRLELQTKVVRRKSDRFTAIVNEIRGFQEALNGNGGNGNGQH